MPGSRANRMTAVLSLSTAICGPRAAHAVIEPLLADWQRQLDGARADGALARVRVAISGCAALTSSVFACAISEGVWIPPLRGTMFSILAIAFSVAVSIVVLLIPPMPLAISRDIADPMTQRWLLVMASPILPPTFLLAMFMHRRDPHTTWRHGIVGVVLSALAMVAVVLVTSPEAINRRFNTFEFQEQIRTRLLAAAKSDPDIWKGRSRALTLSTTVEERRASYERTQAYFAARRKQEPPPTIAQRFVLVQPILLSIVFSAMGWTLGGLRHPTVSRGLIWWTLVFMATIAMTNMLSLLVGVPMPRPPQWAMLPLFASLTLVLIASVQLRAQPTGGDR